MPKIIVKPGQSLFDVALQHYGSVEGVFDLVRRNQLNGITDNVYAGDELDVAEVPLHPRMKAFLSRHSVATMEESLRPQGIGWWKINHDFVLGDSGRSAQSISFSLADTGRVGGTIALSATASSGLPLVYISSSPSIAAVSMSPRTHKSAEDFSFGRLTGGITYYNDHIYNYDYNRREIRKYSLAGDLVSSSSRLTFIPSDQAHALTYADNKFWIPARTGHMYVLSADDLTRSATSEFSLTTQAFNGITYAEERLYIVSYGSNTVNVYDLEGNRDESREFSLEGLAITTPNFAGITYGHGLFWIAEVSTKRIYAYNPKGQRQSVHDFGLDASLRGMAYGQGRLFVASDRNHGVTVYTPGPGIRLLAEGSATIVAIQVGNDTYKLATAEQHITINP